MSNLPGKWKNKFPPGFRTNDPFSPCDKLFNAMLACYEKTDFDGDKCYSQWQAYDVCKKRFV